MADEPDAFSARAHRAAAVRRSVLLIASVVGTFTICFYGFISYVLWRAEAADGSDIESGDLIIIGRITGVGMTDDERIDAREDTPIDRYHFVQFQVEEVKKGSWELPDLTVAVHSPSSSFGASKGKTGARHVVAFEQRTYPSGKSYLFLKGSQRCVWILPPCHR